MGIKLTRKNGKIVEQVFTICWFHILPCEHNQFLEGREKMETFFLSMKCEDIGTRNC